MLPITLLSKRKEEMDPYPTISLIGALLDLVTTSSTHNTSPSTLEKIGISTQDIEAFMNQAGNATLVNAIIDKNLNTIIVNF